MHKMKKKSWNIIIFISLYVATSNNSHESWRQSTLDVSKFSD